MVLDPFNARR
jgi:hypothetical protein